MNPETPVDYESKIKEELRGRNIDPKPALVRAIMTLLIEYLNKRNGVFTADRKEVKQIIKSIPSMKSNSGVARFVRILSGMKSHEYGTRDGEFPKWGTFKNEHEQ